ncbi:Succinate dehydrogenase hydrophobic membrane anchor subunit [Alteripontixanthobacter maritimus]|uniref:Succinate dehydrogenase hydrophobic membrane anchor subunit n=1 Tax=Alteripontixanthobacter maritimus TaxID=2161824 RepID=A0A369Q5F9_9SPHN|nr:succinate dehydrogenase, hydrophobic membrane anchor protein [Alteripontixanthobacter maritimus]RDC60131.1 Succinate dehydrogenase hydrophobic membrane anchor subunit [Alteripontixanthobacter maritimus]
MGDGTSIGRVRGLGSSHDGAHHWLLQRFTAIGNLLLVLWFVVSIVLLPDMGYETVTKWLGAPLPAVAMALLIVSTFWHAKLGLTVLTEDYVHTPGNKFSVLVLLNLATIGGAAFSVFCIARLALVGN